MSLWERLNSFLTANMIERKNEATIIPLYIDNITAIQLGDDLWPYLEYLSSTAGFKPVPAVVQKMVQ